MRGKRLSITHGRRRYKILVDKVVDANPEHNVYTSEADKAESDATCFDPTPPQSCDECVDSKYLVWCTS
jgi:hypothetical protein